MGNVQLTITEYEFDALQYALAKLLSEHNKGDIQLGKNLLGLVTSLNAKVDSSSKDVSWSYV